MTERLAALLPVRDGARLIPGWLRSVEGVVNEVIALDDGSTDGSGDLLASHPLVSLVLRNRRHVGYAGWDDRGNRQALVDAAVARGIDWVVFLDADERLGPGDGPALRRLVSEARPDRAYGFRIHAATDDLSRYQPGGRYVYRLFSAHRPRTLLPGRLHAPPVPHDIPRRRWIRTGIRLLHVATTEREDREQRRAKYAAADPGYRWQDGYDHLLEAPRPLVPVPPFEGPLLLPIHDREADSAHPAISVVVVARDEEDRIAGCVESVIIQEVPVSFEVIVVVSGEDGTARVVRDRFPEVAVEEIPGEALPGRARNLGLGSAAGDVVAFLSAGVRMRPGSLAARYAAHEDGWAMVGGPVVNRNPTPAGRASHLLEHASALPGRPSGEMQSPPVRCSYVRFLLDEIGGFPEDLRAGEDTVVNTELFARGYSAYFAAGAVEEHGARARTRGELQAHHRSRGAAWARILASRHGGAVGAVVGRGWALSLYPWHRLRRLRRCIRHWGGASELGDRRVRSLVRAGAFAAWRGLIGGLVAGRGHRRVPGPAGRVGSPG